MRSCVLGIINYNDISQVIRQTQDIGKVTHADPRSLAASVAQTVAISLMLQGVCNLDTLFEAVNDISSNFIENYTRNISNEVTSQFTGEKLAKFNESILEIQDQFTGEILRKYINIDLNTLKPIDGEDMGYAYICLGCAFDALRQETFEDAIRRIVIEGGDADTNAAAAGALLGCKLGFSRLPQHLVQELLHKEWLEEKINRLLNKILN